MKVKKEKGLRMGGGRIGVEKGVFKMDIYFYLNVKRINVIDR